MAGEGWRGRGTDMELLQEVTWPPRERPLVYVCEPTPFVEKATISLIALGHEPGRVRVLHEAFGPTGVYALWSWTEMRSRGPCWAPSATR